MPFSYKPLWKKLIDKDMTKKQLMEVIPISKSTIDKMGKSKYVSLGVLDKLCNYFHCPLENIVEHIRNEVN